MSHQSFTMISDFREKVENDEILVCSVGRDNAPKAPTYKISSLVKGAAAEHSPNLGVYLPPEHKLDRPFLAIIDIDGEKGFFKDDPVKNKQYHHLSRDFLFFAMKEYLTNNGIEAMYVQTASGGYHIYLYVMKSRFQQHGWNKFVYFKDHMNLPLLEKYEFFRKNKKQLMDFRLKTMDNKCLEIFTQNTMVVAPGSVFDNGVYTVLPEGAQTFSDISVYDEKPVEELVEDILIAFQCGIDTSAKQNQFVVEENRPDEQSLSHRDVKAIGNLVIELWPDINSQKQEATLALGGFLYSRGVSQRSIMEIGDYVIDNKNDPNFFKGTDEYERTQGFMAAMLHDTLKQESKQKTGLTSIVKKFEGHPKLFKIAKTLWISTNPSFHSFYPDGNNTQNYNQITMDFKSNEMTMYTLTPKTTKEGEFYEQRLNSDKISHCIQNLTSINDISAPFEEDDFEKPLEVELVQKNGNSIKKMFKTPVEFFINYHNTVGVACSKTTASKIIRSIYTEYNNLSLIDEKEFSSRPGIYYSETDKKIHKFISKSGQIIEEKPILPSKQKLKEALELLTQINEVYPWAEGKFGIFTKMSFLLPYGYIFKNNFGKHTKGIILSGESGALKSTAGELVCNFNHFDDKDRDLYMMGGGEITSEYRFGRAFDNFSYPIVINECEDTFARSEIRELLKNAITGVKIRSPGGQNATNYLARTVPILTVNNMPFDMEQAEFARRFLQINFTGSERGDTKEMRQKLSFLNNNGIVNSRFKELKIIGDYIFYLLERNIDLFRLDPEELADKIVISMSEYTGADLDWMLEADVEEFEQEDREDENQFLYDLCIKTIQRTLTPNRGALLNNTTSEQSLITAINSESTYIKRTANGVLIKPGFKQEFARQNKDINKTIMITKLAELINDYGGLEYPVTVKKMMVLENRKLQRGVYIDWGDFLKLLNVRKDIVTENPIITYDDPEEKYNKQ